MSSNICRVKCGDKELEIKIQRPSFNSVKMGYAEIRYKHIGGKIETLFNSNKRTYVNTCALRISYALNYSTHPINAMDKQIAGRNYHGADKHIYYLGVFDIIKLLKINWKEISWNKSTYSQVKESIKCGCSKDFCHTMASKDENQKFFKELQSLT